MNFLFGNAVLAAFIPAVGLGTWLVHRVRPGFVSSVRGRVRWGWLALCCAALVPLWAVYLGVLLVLPGDEPTGPVTITPEPQWVALLAITLVTTPLQSAGEEYLFRGWLMQQIGAWIAHRWVALGLSAALSAGLFALAHTSFDPWILLDLVIFAAVATLVTWWTGGLEAAVAVHAVNNVLGLLLAIAFGQLSSSFITPESAGAPVQTLVSGAVSILGGAVIVGLARWRRLERCYRPVPAAPTRW